MPTFRYDNFCGEILYGGRNLFFGCADLNDVCRIAKMYSDISINAENYRVRLDPYGTESFSNIGGMFKIHTEESIQKEITDDSSFFAVIKDNNNIIASFWVSKNDPQFLNFSPLGFSCTEQCCCTLTEALRRNTVVYPRELIVLNRQRISGIAHTLFFTIFSVMQKNGYTHSLGEVYGVHSYRDRSEAVVIDMLNERSFRMVQGTGGQCIGVFPKREIPIGHAAVTIESRIFCFDYSALLPGLSQRLKNLGMDIKFYEEISV